MTRLARQARSAAGMLLGSTGAAVAGLRGADAAVRAALPLSRRVGVVALAGGSGSTATVASVGSLLARRRRGSVLAVDAAGGAAGLRRTLLGDDDIDGRDTDPDAAEAAAARRRSARTAADARAGLARTPTGLHLLDLSTRDRHAASVDGWGLAVGPVARFFDLVLTDWGVRSAGEVAEVAATSHVLVLVARAERQAAELAARTLVGLGAEPGAPQTLLALTDVARTPDRVAPALRRALGRPVLLLPHEPERSRTLAPTSRRFGSRTRDAHLRLAVAVVDAAVTSQQPVTSRRGDPPPLPEHVRVRA